ncbi:hypothetical protein C8J57DRAFT_1271896 [Mycena rebaudengoi]|nr:hypothetical protein C8J57DRAFT_1271896 [Mycena rebaudengoi]
MQVFRQSRLALRSRVFGYRFTSVASSSQVPGIPRTELPSPPPPPPALPFSSVPAITQREVEQYVHPLIEYKWRVFEEMPNLILVEDQLVRHARMVPVLGKKFSFLRSKGARKFLSSVVYIAQKENHEPTISFFLGHQKQHAIVRTHTPKTLDDASSIAEPTAAPGLSAKDARFAILLEQCFQILYVGAQLAHGLPPMYRRPIMPDLSLLQTHLNWARVPAEAKMDFDSKTAEKAVSPSTVIPAIPEDPSPEDAGTVCTDEHLRMFLQPLYARGWRVGFLPIIGSDRQFVRTLCITGLFRFTTLAAATTFVQDFSSTEWWADDNVELYFHINSRTVRVELVYPREQSLLTLRNVRTALRIERIFWDQHAGSMRLSDVHPYRWMSGLYQPQTIEELGRTREKRMRTFHLRQNAKMAYRQMCKTRTAELRRGQ